MKYSTAIRRVELMAIAAVVVAGCAAGSGSPAPVGPELSTTATSAAMSPHDVTTSTVTSSTAASIQTVTVPSQWPCEVDVASPPPIRDDQVGNGLYCFGEDAVIVLIPRDVPSEVEDPIKWAIEDLVYGGLTDEERTRGYVTAFTERSAGAVLSVRLAGSTLRVDLDTSVERETAFFTLAGGVEAPIVATGLQFPEVEAVELLVSGVPYCEVVPDLSCEE